MNRLWRNILGIIILVVAIAAIIFIVRAYVKPAPKPVTIKSGTSASISGVKWSVVSVLKTRQIGPPGQTTMAKGWYLVVDLYLVNNSHQQINLDPTALTLVDNRQKEYSVSKTATDKQLINLANPKVLSIYQAAVAPGGRKRVVTVFEISEDASVLLLKVNGGKIGSDRDLHIDLGF